MNLAHPTPSISTRNWAAHSARLRGAALSLALFSFLQSPLCAASIRLLGATQPLRSLFASLLYLVMTVGLIFGVIKVIQGAIALTQGESGWGQIIGGSMIAAAPTIMVFAFESGGLADIAIKPGDIKQTP